jgi:predicted transcriptional regulator
LNESEDWSKYRTELLKKRQANLEKGRIENHQKRKEREVIVESNILDIINTYTIHNNGILVKEIAKKINLSTRSVTHYIQNLRNKGKIKTSEKTGKLVSTSDVFKDPIINAELFGYFFKTRLLNKSNKNFILKGKSTYFKSKNVVNLNANNYEVETQALQIDSINYNKLFTSDNPDRYRYEKLLFEYSNRIGSFITYLIMYALNPDNYNENNDNNLSSLSDNDKDEVAKEIINKGIISIIPSLARTFTEILDKTTGKYPSFKDMKTKIEYLTHSPKLIIDDKKSFLSLVNSFTRLYPSMSYEFEKIMLEQNRYLFSAYLIGQQSGIEAYKQYMKDFYEHLQKEK